MTSLIAALLGATAVAFGAVYPWGYTPIALAALAFSLWHWRFRRPRSLAAWAALILPAAIAVQLLPLGAATLQRVSPAAFQVAAGLDVAFANGIRTTHPLTVNPAGTAMALAAVVLAILWVPACAAVLQRPRALRTLARNIAIVGTILALVGLAQKATFNGKVLWFWTPEFHAWNSFGPFVNRNHFAGWMLLALGLTVGLLLGRMSRVAPPPDASVRERLLWLGSPAATPVLLTAAAALTMLCSVLWAMSRSGIAATAVVLLIVTSAAVMRSGRTRHRVLLSGCAVTAVMAVVAWRGTDTLANWYARTGTLEWRIQLWKDSLPALSDFWVTGSGLNTYATLMLVYPRTDLNTLPRAAHNDYLQLAIEGGLLVGVPALILLAAVVREIVRRLREPQDETTWWIRMGAAAGLCGMAVQEISEFSLHIPAVALLFSTLLAIAIHHAPPAATRRQSRPESAPRQAYAA